MSRSNRRNLCSLLILLASLLLSLRSAEADGESFSANSRVSGQFSELEAFSRTVDQRPCANERCEVAGTWNFQATYQNRAFGQVHFKRAWTTRNIQRSGPRSSINDIATRPILLRGYATMRHSRFGENKRVKVAGAVLRDSSKFVLQFTLPSMVRQGNVLNGTLENRPVVFRAPLVSSTARLNTRAEHASTFAFQNLACSEALKMSARYPTSSAKSTADLPTSEATMRVIYVATDFDPSFVSTANCTGSTCNNKIVAWINQAALYYESQFGYTFEVARQFGPTTFTSAGDVKTVLSDFLAFNNANRASLPVDIYQLFTGKEFANGVVGLAFVGVTCTNKQAADLLTRHLSDLVNPLIVAHETGHTLNAEHVPSGIMAPTLQEPLPSSFSAESVAQISNHLATNYPSCVGGAQVKPTPTSTSTPTPTPTETTAPGVTPNATPTPRTGAGPGTPTPTPVATPTRRPSGGSGSDGGGIGPTTPVTLGLSGSVDNQGTVKINVKVSQVYSGCTVQIRGGASSDGAYSGGVVTSFAPTEATTQLSAQVPFKVVSSKRTASNIFLGADYSCNGSPVEVSLIRKLNPNKIRKNTKSISKTAWLKKLSDALTD